MAIPLFFLPSAFKSIITVYGAGTGDKFHHGQTKFVHAALLKKALINHHYSRLKLCISSIKRGIKPEFPRLFVAIAGCRNHRHQVYGFRSLPGVEGKLHGKDGCSMAAQFFTS